MMKYSGISRWIEPKTPLSFYCLKQFLTERRVNKETNKYLPCNKGKEKSKEIHRAGKNLVGSFRLMDCQHMGH
jgi:hypothetical protein